MALRCLGKCNIRMSSLCEEMQLNNDFKEKEASVSYVLRTHCLLCVCVWCRSANVSRKEAAACLLIKGSQASSTFGIEGVKEALPPKRGRCQLRLLEGTTMHSGEGLCIDTCHHHTCKGNRGNKQASASRGPPHSQAMGGTWPVGPHI